MPAPTTHLPPFAHAPRQTRPHTLGGAPHGTHGFGLIELLVCISVMATLATWAIASAQRLQTQRRIEAAREQLLLDLQAARLRAVQRGEALELARLTGCAWASSASDDWSCGWQLRSKTSQVVLQSSPQHTPLKIIFDKTNPLDISVRGDLGTVGDRWVIQARQADPNLANVVCLNSASRLRWRSGASCSD